MGQYCIAGWRLSLSSVTLLAGWQAGRRERGRSAHRQPDKWESGGRHPIAGQSCYVPLGQHLISLGSRGGTVFTAVCLSVFPHDISKTHSARIIKRMFQDESWKSIYLGGQKVTIYDAVLCTLVSAGFFQFISVVVQHSTRLEIGLFNVLDEPKK